MAGIEPTARGSNYIAKVAPYWRLGPLGHGVSQQL
jgi:hypothetical protein